MAVLFNKLSSSLPHSTKTSLSSTHHPTLFTLLLRCSTAPNPSEPQVPDHHFMAEYLISSVGLTPDQATRASKNLVQLQTRERPDSVIRFLKEIGLDDAHVKSLISWHPRLLCASVEKTLEPRARELEKGGFSGAMLVQLLRSNPFALTLNGVLQRLNFWKEFIGGGEQSFLKVVKRNRMLINYDIDKKIIPNITILRNYGLSDKDIVSVMMRVNGFILRSPISIRRLVEETEELGFPLPSGMFVQGLSVVAMIKRSTLEKKVEFFKSFGWSEEEIQSAFRKYPNILTLAEENVRSKVEFLIGQVNCLPEYIISRPLLLAYSLQKRLLPRYHVLAILQSKGFQKNRNLYTVAGLPESSFVEKFILPYKSKVPDLEGSYVSACAGMVPAS
ncbi:transcription termination factor MTERF8, chloroplastic-like [Typha latifolia]|uniref:transcription termination factor MTERF8, chloroplastic-like n=1 Tax=Typha latifolia TaxID=4733 RepID=UPI003C2DE5B9